MTKREIIQKALENMEETSQFADGFDDAIIGLAQHLTPEGVISVVIYDETKCIEILAAGMDVPEDQKHEAAQEFFDFNVLNAYMGPTTPIFVRRVEVLEEEM